jgi:histidine triad (HIT) family protein
VTAAYDPNNIFAKILRCEAPCVRLFEDEVSLAFMDIMPRADGHALIIPKAPARNIFDISPADLARFAPSVQRLAQAAMKGMAAEGISVMQFNESAGGQVVFHLHFHILPRWTGVQLRPPGGPIASADQLEPAAAKIRAALRRRPKTGESGLRFYGF